MSREQYMKELAYLLQDITVAEREEALAYYEDYFEEAGQDEEASVIASLGSPQKVAAIIKNGLNSEDSQAGEYTDTGYRDKRFNEYNKVPQSKGSYRYDESRTERPRRSTGEIILLIVICIFAIPVGIPLIGAAFGIVAGFLGVLIALAVCIVVLTFAALICGVAFIGVGIVKAFVAPGLGILLLGGGMISFAIGILALLGCIAVFGKFLPWVIRGIVALIRAPFKRGGSVA